MYDALETSYAFGMANDKRFISTKTVMNVIKMKDSRLSFMMIAEINIHKSIYCKRRKFTRMIITTPKVD